MNLIASRVSVKRGSLVRSAMSKRGDMHCSEKWAHTCMPMALRLSLRASFGGVERAECGRQSFPFFFCACGPVCDCSGGSESVSDLDEKVVDCGQRRCSEAGALLGDKKAVDLDGATRRADLCQGYLTLQNSSASLTANLHIQYPIIALNEY